MMILPPGLEGRLPERVYALKNIGLDREGHVVVANLDEPWPAGASLIIIGTMPSGRQCVLWKGDVVPACFGVMERLRDGG